MNLGFFIILALTCVVGLTVSGATLWACVAQFGLVPTLGMYVLAAIAVYIQVRATMRAR